MTCINNIHKTAHVSFRLGNGLMITLPPNSHLELDAALYRMSQALIQMNPNLSVSEEGIGVKYKVDARSGRLDQSLEGAQGEQRAREQLKVRNDEDAAMHKYQERKDAIIQRDKDNMERVAQHKVAPTMVHVPKSAPQAVPTVLERREAVDLSVNLRGFNQSSMNENPVMDSKKKVKIKKEKVDKGGAKKALALPMISETDKVASSSVIIDEANF